MTLRAVTRELGASIAILSPECKHAYCLSENRTLRRSFPHQGMTPRAGRRSATSQGLRNEELEGSPETVSCDPRLFRHHQGLLQRATQQGRLANRWLSKAWQDGDCPWSRTCSGSSLGSAAASGGRSGPGHYPPYRGSEVTSSERRREPSGGRRGQCRGRLAWRWAVAEPPSPGQNVSAWDLRRGYRQLAMDGDTGDF